MPSAIKHDHELSARGLVSVLVHAQKATPTELQAFMLAKFPDNDCLLAPGGFVPTPESKGIPHGSLIGVDGKLLWDGHPVGDAKVLGELIEAELQKVKKGWGDTAEQKKVRAALYGKNDLFGAAMLIAAMPEGDARSKLQTELDVRYAAGKKRITALQEQGRWLDAQQAAKELTKCIGAKAEWISEVQPLVASFDTEAGKAELAADKKLEKIEKQLREKKGDNAGKALAALIKSAANTKVAERAQRIATALETPLP